MRKYIKSGINCKLIAVLILVLGCWVVAKKGVPQYNWDLVAYIGVMYSYETNDKQVIHERTYSAIRDDVPIKIIENYNANSYCKDLSENYKHFFEQLPFYTVKPVYPTLIFILNKLGVPPVQSSIYISRAAYILTISFMFYWLRRYLPIVIASFITTITMVFSQVVALAKLSTPDALSCLVILLGLYFLVERNNIKLALLTLTFGILIRPDTLLLVIFLCTYLVLKKRHRSVAIACVFVSVTLYILVVKLSGNYGWTVLFYHSFVSPLLEPNLFQPALQISDYLNIYKSLLIKAIYVSYFKLYILLNVLALLLSLRRNGVRNQSTQLLIVTLVFMISHWLLFPDEKERQLAAILIFSIISISMDFAKGFFGKDISSQWNEDGATSSNSAIFKLLDASKK